jgi:hypothetical protein
MRVAGGKTCEHAPDGARENPSAMTVELLAALRDARTIEEFSRQYGNDYINMSLVQYLEIILETKKLKKAEVIKASNLNKVFAYQIFSGVKNPSRDKLLALAFAMRLTYEECQRMLRLAGVNELYVKNRRDSILIFGFMKGLELIELNHLLYEMDEFVL